MGSKASRDVESVGVPLAPLRDVWGPSRWLSLAGEARGSARARGILEALPWRQAEARPSYGTSKARYAFVRAPAVCESRKLQTISPTPHCWPT